MSCTLKKFQTYDVGRVVHDSETGSVNVQLTNPPDTCPDRVFNSKKAEIKVQDGLHPLLTFDTTTNTPVVLVPNTAYVEEVQHGHGFFFWTGVILVIALVIAAVVHIYKKVLEIQTDSLEEKPTETAKTSSYTHPAYHPSSTPTPTPAPEQHRTDSAPIVRSSAPVQHQGSTVVVNQQAPNNSSDGLITGLILGEMLSSHHSDRIIEREVIRETPIAPAYREDRSDYSSDEDSNRKSASSDNYSSDDSSSSSDYSSDDSSSDSYSSDSSSSDSYSSSDSSSSFSSDF